MRPKAEHCGDHSRGYRRAPDEGFDDLYSGCFLARSIARNTGVGDTS